MFKARPTVSAVIRTLMTIGVVVMLGFCYAAYEQAERERIAPWKEGWNYEGASQALKMSPNEPSAHAAMASVWMKHKQYNKAVQEYQKAVKLEPANAYTHRDLGNAYESSGQLPKAKLQWRQAINLDVPGGEASKTAAEKLAAFPAAR